MIPKIIHYCWFGKKPLSELAIKCINSWKTYLPDCKIIEWNELNFDVNSVPYVKEAYAVKKYAFVSDYARFRILNEYGGIYFDVDVEVVKNMDDIISRGPYMGCQKQSNDSSLPEDADELLVNPGLGFASYPQMPFLKEMLDFYEKSHFLKEDGSFNLETIVTYTTSHLMKYGLVNIRDIQNVAGFNIYPKEFFNPRESNGRIVLTNNTYSIHHFDASWQSPILKFKIKIIHFILDCFGTGNIKRILVKLKIR